MKIVFFTRGFVEQTVKRLTDRYIYQEIEKGLESGKFITSVEANNNYIIDAKTNEKIALIQSTKTEDVINSDFTVSED